MEAIPTKALKKRGLLENLFFFHEQDIHCKKNVNDFPVSRRDVTDQTDPWPGIIKFFPARESLVSDIPAGDGKFDKLFFTVYMVYFADEKANPQQDLNKGVQMRFFLPIA